MNHPNRSSSSRRAAPRSVVALAFAITAALALALLWWWSSGLYLWIKAFHIIALIAWMAGMLYLPRLFVYHAVTEVGSPQSETFKVMERRLLRAIMNPAMIATWFLGLWLAWQGDWFRAPWLHGKLVLVLLLSAAHGLFARWVKDFAADRNRHSQRFYRIANEVPTVLLIGIVILVVIKPF